MLRTDFHFDLPPELVAQRPSDTRGDDKLMVLGRFTGSVSHRSMGDLPDLIDPGVLMVFNDSKVRKSRVFGIKETTGRAEEFVFLAQTDGEGLVWDALVRSAKKQKPGMKYFFGGGAVGTILDDSSKRGSETRTVRMSRPLDESWFDENGHVPLPPYIKRADDEADASRYQTVYAKKIGSAACPTAGLHFTGETLSRLRGKGVEIVYVTLNVGLGTFLPVREERIEDHKMHEETYTISEKAAESINRARSEGREILAVGTTSARSLEASAGIDGAVKAGTRSTGIFMYPGYNFRVVDSLFTNFHTPESTLLMLVSAFAGRDSIMNAYAQAIENRYLFFSYGDAMLIR